MTCDGGITWRSRLVKRQANECGYPGVGLSRETASCNVGVPCIKSVDCKFSEWSRWSDCNSHCNGDKNRVRSIEVHARGTGEACKGPLKEVTPCNPGEGESPPLDCVIPDLNCSMSSWNPWSECSQTCDTGNKRRFRDILQAPEGSGKACDGTLGETTHCMVKPCQAECMPVPCKWADWQQWGDCDKCGGQKRRVRHVIEHPACGGEMCEPGHAEEVDACPRKCHDKVFCTWAEWGGWGQCDAICGKGARIRQRELTLLVEGTDEYAAAEKNWTGQIQSRQDHQGSVEAIAGLDERTIEEKLKMLKLQTQGIETRRYQELIVSFACGGISLVAVLLVFRVYSRSVENRDTLRYDRTPLTANQE